MTKEVGNERNFFFVLAAIFAIISLIIVLPFLATVVTGAILAFVFHPLYERLRRIFRFKSLSALITAILILLIVAVPFVFVVKNVTSQSHYFYLRTKQQLFGGELIESSCYEKNFVCNTVKDINEVLRDENIKMYLIDRLNEFLGFVTNKISNILFSLPRIILHLFVVLFTIYYMLKDGKEFVQRIAKVAPLKVHHQDQIIKQFGDVTYAIIYGSFIVALVQGALGAFGFWIFGVNNFLLWAVVMTFFALIPFVGTWVVWMPASIFLLLSGYLQGEVGLLWRGVGLFFYGLLIISTIDNFLKPLIVAGRSDVHPLVVIVGILGGIFTFGISGLLIGPIILALFHTLLKIYEREKVHHINEPEPDIIGKRDHHGTRR